MTSWAGGAVPISLLVMGTVSSLGAAEYSLRVGRPGVAARVGLSDQRPDSFHARLGSAREQVRSGRFQQAIPLLKTLLAEDPASAEAHMLLGVALRSLAAPDFLGEAQAELRQALMLDPGLHWARFALARIYMDLGRDARAQQELEAGLKGLPNQPLFLSFLGEVYRRLGHPQRSLTLCEEALTREPKLSIPRLHRALAWRDLGEPGKAVKELEAGLQGAPVLPEMLRTLGVLYLQTEKTDQAVRILERAVALEPSSAEGHLHLARAHLQQRQPDEALRQLTQALPAGATMLTSPYFQNLEADVYFAKGEAYWMKGEKEAALKAYRRVLEIAPDHREARDRLARPY
ncbi:MAG: tetratricopeptide repeat protein [Vicinamibacterales bacterium]